MPTPHTFVEPTRLVPPARPDFNGNLRGSVVLSPAACKTRAAVPVPSLNVLPIIVVPGIMGSNLRATTDTTGEKNTVLAPGTAAWRPPNGFKEGLDAAKTWKKRDPYTRQGILDPETLEVDGNGFLDQSLDPDYAIDPDEARDHGWGEIHWSSYGPLLLALRKTFNHVYYEVNGSRGVLAHWQRVNTWDRAEWSAVKSGAMAELSASELQRVASYHYPIYAFGYNWLQSNESSGRHLAERIEKIIAFWRAMKRDCKQVILVTHSMGGLVARACAKGIPSKIAGIVHGVMPALGAPVCYRRIACGTETSSPSNSTFANIAAGKFADIAGRTTETTTPVLATASGPLELLPTHLYPQPWLYLSLGEPDAKKSVVSALHSGNPYDLYRDTASWYRMIDPHLADPLGKYKEKVAMQIKLSIDQAESFHRTVIGNDYHSHTYAFYGVDHEHLSFGTCQWIAPKNVTADSLVNAQIIGRPSVSERKLRLADGSVVLVKHSVQDVSGDGTVPHQSGEGPSGHVEQIFGTAGYDHQGSYGDESMLSLTQHLVAKIVQRAK